MAQQSHGTISQSRYTTLSDLHSDEQLCMSYGRQLWFNLSGVTSLSSMVPSPTLDQDDGWGGLTDQPNHQDRFSDGDQDEILEEDALPFTRFKPPPEEEDAESIRTVSAWVVDVPDPRHLATLIKWIKQANLETPDISHLKRIRKHPESATPTLLLSLQPDPPPLPNSLGLAEPYHLLVPALTALTLSSLALKSAIWPTIYTPKRKDEPELWTRGKAHWACDAMQIVVQAAASAHIELGELPIAAYTPAPHNSVSELLSFTANDTRKSTSHPLRHAAINMIRRIADRRATCQDQSSPSSSLHPPPDTTEAGHSENGTNYLLTGLTVFMTHEPCIMCSMALLHSRVKEVIYLHPMPLTGGCGGSACLPTLQGVNHRFGIGKWKEDYTLDFIDDGNLDVDTRTDA